MLKFNMNTRIKELRLFYLNTSYVKVQQKSNYIFSQFKII